MVAACPPSPYITAYIDRGLDSQIINGRLDMGHMVTDASEPYAVINGSTPGRGSEESCRGLSHKVNRCSEWKSSAEIRCD